MLGPRLLSFLFDFGCLDKMNEKRDFGFLLGYSISGEFSLLFHCFLCSLECIYDVFLLPLR